MLKHSDWMNNTLSRRLYDAGNFAPKAISVAANEIQAVTYSSLSHCPHKLSTSSPINAVRYIKSRVGILALMCKMGLFKQHHLLLGCILSLLQVVPLGSVSPGGIFPLRTQGCLAPLNLSVTHQSQRQKRGRLLHIRSSLRTRRLTLRRMVDTAGSALRLSSSLTASLGVYLL